MNPFSFQNDNLDEVVFEHRNKQYGAYVLRKSYDGNLLKASASSLGVFIVFGGMIYGVSLFRSEIPKMVPPVHVTPVQTMMRNIEIILDPPEASAAAAPRGTSNTFRIVRDPEVIPPAQTHPQDPVSSSTGTQGGVEGGTGTTVTSGTGTGIETGSTTIVTPAPFATFVEEMPTYVGGEEAMIRYLSNNINYPANARENGIEGKVIVSFVVQTDGSISMIELKKGIGFGCDDEALRVIAAMPKWNVGRQNGKLMAVKMVLPIYFKLQ